MKAGGRGITTAVVAEVVLHVYLLLWRSSSSVQADQGYGTSTTQMATCYNSDGSPISTTDVAVSTTAEATELGEHLLLCPGVEFTVSWRGSVTLAQPLAFSNGTFLKIAGFSEDSLIDGGGATHLFEVNGSSAVLDIEALSLTGGKGASGGVVVARDGAVVTLSACDVFENEAASKGGEGLLCGKMMSDRLCVCYHVTPHLENTSRKHLSFVRCLVYLTIPVSGSFVRDAEHILACVMLVMVLLFTRLLFSVFGSPPFGSETESRRCLNSDIRYLIYPCGTS